MKGKYGERYYHDGSPCADSCIVEREHGVTTFLQIGDVIGTGMLLEPPMFLPYLSRVKENMDKGLILREISCWLTNGEKSNGLINFNNFLCLILSLSDFLIWWNNILVT